VSFRDLSQQQDDETPPAKSLYEQRRDRARSREMKNELRVKWPGIGVG